MLPNKLKRLQSGAAPTRNTKVFTSGYGFYLNHARGLTDFYISAAQSNQAVIDKPSLLSFIGTPTEDGRYEYSFHCHGESLIGGRELAEAMLGMAAKNASVEATLQGDYLHFRAKTTAPLLAAGRVRGSYGERFTAMLKVSAPEESGKAIASGIALTNSSGGAFSITDTAVYEGGEVQMIGTSSATRQIVNISVASTQGMLRVMDLSSFGVFRGAVSAEDFTPYWGTETSVILSEPLRVCNSLRDHLYPMRGYAERFTDAYPLLLDGLCEASFGASVPSFHAPIPEVLIGKTYSVDCLATKNSESAFLSTPFCVRTSADGAYLEMTGSEKYDTHEKFLALMREYNATAIVTRQTPRYEFFDPIAVETRKGQNHLDTKTEIAPYRLGITYY